MTVPPARALLWPVTRVYELDEHVYTHAEQIPEPVPMHESPCHLPVIPQASYIVIGQRAWRVVYVALLIDEARGESVLSYTVEDPRRAPPRRH